MVLLIDHHDSFTYNIKQLIEECQSNFIDVISCHSVQPDDVARYDRVVLSPGPETPSHYPYFKWFFPMVLGNKSVLGVCLGHQAIGCYFGAKLTNLERVYHGITQKVMIRVTADPLFCGMPESFNAGLYHSWALDPLNFPDDLAVTAVSSEGVIMAVRHRCYDIAGVQFHPESVMTTEGRRIVKNWLTQPSRKRTDG